MVRIIRVVTEQEAQTGVKARERPKRPIDQTLQESCDTISLARLRGTPGAGYGVKASEFYTPDQIADLLHCHPATVRRWLGTGKLAGFKTFGGSEWRVKGVVVLRMIDGLD